MFCTNSFTTMVKAILLARLAGSTANLKHAMCLLRRKQSQNVRCYAAEVCDGVLMHMLALEHNWQMYRHETVYPCVCPKAYLAEAGTSISAPMCMSALKHSWQMHRPELAYPCAHQIKQRFHMQGLSQRPHMLVSEAALKQL